jgi:hypothetical protein
MKMPLGSPSRNLFATVQRLYPSLVKKQKIQPHEAVKILETFFSSEMKKIYSEIG